MTINDDPSNIFATNIRISNMSCFDNDAIWPQGIEIAIFRIPIRKRDGYSTEMMTNLANKLKAHMAINGIAFIVCYAPQEAKARPFEVANTMVNSGFTHVDSIIIKRSWLPGKRSEVNLVNSHEYALYFCNGTVWKLDRHPIRQYLRTPDEVSCPGNCWEIDVGSLDEAYPEDLAELLIGITDSLPGSQVFDPFMKNSASLKACLKLGHSLTGFETDPKRIKRYEKIIKDHSDKRKK